MKRIKQKKPWKTRKQRGGDKHTVDNLKINLASYAHSDAQHDFSKVSDSNFYSLYKDEIDKSIPSAPYTIYKEDNILKSITITQINENNTSIPFSITTLMDEYVNKDGLLDIELALDDTIKRKYTAHVIYYQEDKTVITKPEDFEYYFGGMRTFVIDFFTMKFFDGFKNNTTSELYDETNPYYILYNRETQNDPGNKAKLEEDHYNHTGYCLEEVYDIDDKEIVYPKWTNTKLFYNKLFYSNYNFRLKYEKGGLQLQIDILPIPITDDDPKGNNSISGVLKQMNEGKISAAIAFQKKRCGDALQALSVFDNTRSLTNNNANNYPKMLITHDRMLLYYSLLLGIDVGFTVIRNNKSNNIKQYYLINFINQDDKSAYISASHNYSKKYSGGKENSSKRITIKNLNTNQFQKDMIYYNMSIDFEKLYNLIGLPKFDKYKKDIKIDKLNKLYHEKYLNDYYNYLLITGNLEKNSKFLTFMYSTVFNKEYISNLIYLKYRDECQFGKYYVWTTDDKYLSSIYNIKYYSRHFYNTSAYDNLINNCVKYYEETDKPFANYIKSIHCLLWLVYSYQNTLDDCGFRDCDTNMLNKLLTDDLRQQLENEPCEDEYPDTEEGTLERYASIIKDNWQKYPDLYEKTFYTQDWNFMDFSQIIYYIDTHNLDVFTVLNRLAADYRWAMYKVTPVKPGIQSSAIMIIHNIGYTFDKELERTPEVHEMVEEIDNIKTDLFLADFNRSADTLISLLQRTVEKHLTWGAQLF